MKRQKYHTKANLHKLMREFKHNKKQPTAAPTQSLTTLQDCYHLPSYFAALSTKYNTYSPNSAQAHNHKTVSRKDFNITGHSYQRLRERVFGSDVSKDALLSLAHTARYKGISLLSLRATDFSQIDRLPLYQYLTNNYKVCFSTQQIRWYGQFVFVFGGKHNRTLLTVVRIPSDLLGE